MMDIKQKIDKVQAVLNGGGNVIKTRDDRELILVDKDRRVQNTDSCGWICFAVLALLMLSVSWLEQ